VTFLLGKLCSRLMALPSGEAMTFSRVLFYESQEVARAAQISQLIIPRPVQKLLSATNGGRAGQFAKFDIRAVVLKSSHATHNGTRNEPSFPRRRVQARFTECGASGLSLSCRWELAQAAVR